MTSQMNSFNWFIMVILGPCSRYGVDIFLMLSGALSLGREWEIRDFLAKRLPRITLPYLFWGFVLSACLVIIGIIYPGMINGLDPCTSIWAFLTFLYDVYMAKSAFFGQYWFFWMILGTYLIMPVFNKWLLHADLKEAEYFLCLWLITCIFDYTLFTPFPIKLSYFTSPIGLVVLGYYLRHTQRKIFNSPYFGIVLFLIGFFILVIGSYLGSTPDNLHHYDRYSIYVMIEVIGIFLMFKNYSKLNIKSKWLNNPDGILRKSVFSIAKYSYGIYLVHEFFLRGILKSVLPHYPFKIYLNSERIP